MFYSRNICRKHLVGNKKPTTFAPALREKHGSTKLKQKRYKQIKIYFSRKFGSSKISITFAPRLNDNV